MSGGEDEVARPRPTMREVAALAGVSIKTVSRVVNREAGVSEQLRAQVARAANQLDYRHNLAASNLRRSSGRTGLIGALLQDVGNSFSATLLRALEDAARDRGAVVLAASLDEEGERERTLVGDLVSRRVDGLVLMPATPRQDYLASELRAGLPTVFVDRAPRGIEVDSVTVDNVAGAREATEHLLAHGHRRIALLADLNTIQTAERRIEGYTAALTSAGLVADPSLVVPDVRTVEEAAQVTTRLLELWRPPTAVLALRNVLSVGAIMALRAKGLQHTVALVGFDDFPLADLLDPPVTQVRQDVDLIGNHVTRLVFARLDGDTSPPQHIVVPYTLVVRGSGEIRAALGS